MTLYQLYLALIDRMKPSIGPREAKACARLLLEDSFLNITPTRLITDGEREMEQSTVDLLSSYADSIAHGYPAQYTVGIAHFMGYKLHVTRDTLIPRPETEGLVDIIVDEWADKADVDVLDIGTGSGCIAIALARALRFPRVSACDISQGALAVARENAATLGVKINFFVADALNGGLPTQGTFDVIVSNPPYITHSEADQVDSHVRMHEPQQALFVDDATPLVFYEAISKYARTNLTPGGRLYFEINPLFAAEMEKMLISHGWLDVEIIRDYVGKLRFAKACLPQ
jgi:release factor glutamine methyltransferase